MVNKFIHYQLLDEREEQLINKAGAESFTLFIGLVLLFRQGIVNKKIYFSSSFSPTC